MKSLLAILLVCLAILACYGEEVYLSLWPPAPGKLAYLTHRSKHPFAFDQEKAFGSKRELAVSQYTPLYSYTPEGAESGKKKMRDLIQRIAAFQGQKEGGEFEKFLKKQFGVELDAESAGMLLKYPNLGNLLQAVLAIEESILQSRIVEDPKPLKGKKTIEILFPKPLGTIAFPAAEVITLDQARETLQSKVSQVFWQVEKSVLDPVVRIALATIASNLKYGPVENDRRIEEIVRRYPSRTVQYSAGDVLIPFRKLLNEEDVLLLSAHQEVLKKRNGNDSLLWVLFVIVFSVGSYVLLLTRILPDPGGSKTPFLLHLTVLVLAVIVSNLLLLLTSFPIYALPVAMVPLLLSILHREKGAIILSSLLSALLTALFAARSLQILLFFGFGAVVALMSVRVIRKRSQVVIPSLLVGLTNAAAVFFALLDGNDYLGWLNGLNQADIHPNPFSDRSVFYLLGWAFVGGIASGPIALLLLPFPERVWNTPSAFKLFRYTDLDHPLMKDLLTKAPGTYQHTMTVAHLTQAASEAIGADSLLARTGAYYHDIGKILDPEHFVENQFGGPNHHRELPPQKSAEIITDHVENGLKLSRESGLPDVINAFIVQHHGTRLLEFFFDKARNGPGGDKISEMDFRYHGPKPQRVETAILMISDAVEAASRTLPEKTREKIDAMVRHIIETRISEGQFDECSLSTRDIATIRETLVNSLAASFHTRVAYPWQKEGEGNEPGKPPTSPPKTIPFRASSG